MTEIFRITGLHNINFDEGAIGPYRLAEGSVPRDMDQILSRQEVISLLAKLPAYPEGLRNHCLAKGVSKVSCDVSIQADKQAGETDADMERYRQRLTRTLEDAGLYIATQGARGTWAVLHYKMNNAINDSYKTIFYGELEEMGGRDVLGAKVKASYLEGMKLTLYCEKHWRPESEILLGPNEIYCPGFEEDADANGRADNWDARGAPVLAMESTIVLQGFYSQKATTDAANEGVENKAMTAPGVTSAVAYAWICRPVAGSNVRVILRETTGGGADIATASLDVPPPGGWRTALAKDKVSRFSQVVVSTAAGITPGNTYELWVESTAAGDTVFYIDKAFWKWGTTVVPDEWCDHSAVYNHYDARWLPNKGGAGVPGAGHEGHINYFDVADLKGTNEARLLIQVEFDKTADKNQAADLIIARRSWWDEPSLPACMVREVHWLEAEDRTRGANWTPEVRARCSGGACVFNGPAGSPTGNTLWDFYPQPCTPNLYMANYLRGRFDVFGMVFATNHANTSYRLSYSGLGGTQILSNQWVKQKNSNQWQLLYLGEVNFDRYLRGGIDSSTTWMKVEYAKDAADTVRLDCVGLLRKSEPMTRLHTPDLQWLPQNDYWVIDRTEDFDYTNKEYDNLVSVGRDATGDLFLQGEVMTLTPQMVKGQRLYFCCETVDLAPAPDERIWEAHGAGASNLQMVVNISYLPQYVSPLE